MQLLFIQNIILILWFWHAQHPLFLSLFPLSHLSHTHAHAREADHPSLKKGIMTNTTEVPKHESGREGKRDQLPKTSSKM